MEFKEYLSKRDFRDGILNSLPKSWANKPFWAIFTKSEITNQVNEQLLSVYLDRGVILYSDGGGLVHKPAESLEKYQLVNINDFVMNNQQAWRGSVGISSYQGIVSPAYLVFKPNKELNPQFLKYQLRDNYLVDQFMISSLSVGTIQRQIKNHLLRAIQVPIPPQDEQKKIATFLDTETARIDNLIAKQEKLIELLEEQRKSIISHAVTKGLNPNAPMKDSGVEWLGEVPEHWNLKPIKFLAKTNQLTLAENTDENYEIQYVDIGSVSRTNGIEKIETILFKDAPSRARRIVKDGDIIVSTVRTYLKAIAYIENPPKNLIVSTGFAVLNPIRTVIFPQYAKFTFLAEQFIAEVIAKSKGISYPAITATELADIKIALPPLNEQKVILQYLLEENLKMNKLISKQNQLIEKLKEYRASIISHAVTGKIDVREFGA
ncbi:type I restriction-modification system specificity determinant for hsdM and hsdR (HsdS) [Acinetobacter baumannii]|uniref:restriction endonuclease subunit S n=1 Tax=Acinetobacter baumannii TaxID=470 RepID=UPI00081980D9|nr:restriction endonuclease subunit S [Acinetobacter baumannii]SCD15625.1 type I restriction-modification system specificity determinant for hsdM and hsdR (HsdS) [Acinetobacter baumannii]SCD15691.1 type I restriction-modification system specificity determinant for hsdM and hsdR (HsdS) [Acinetobacter baumannii]